MANGKIKVKEVVGKTIKSIDKTLVMTDKFKDNIVRVKEKTENIYGSEKDCDYASNKIKYASVKTVDKFIDNFNYYGKKSVIKTKNNISKVKGKINDNKNKKIIKDAMATGKTKIKDSFHAINQTEKVINETIKPRQKAMLLTKKISKKVISGTKNSFKIFYNSVKNIVVGTKAMISLLIAGGWIAAVVIIIICLVGFFCSSIFGIFFSSERVENNITMNSVVKDINLEMANKLEYIKHNNVYDEVVINSSRSDWKDVLMVYSVIVSNGINETDVMILNENKISILKRVFWDMNSISYYITDEQIVGDYDSQLDNFNKNVKKVLNINITSKSVDDMVSFYNFNSMQLKQLDELKKEEYAMLWNSPIYGNPIGSPSMVEVALSQVGNVGGEIYWRWYGFKSRVPWCAIFVSWVADQLGYISSSIIPKFAGCQNGVDWFKAMGEWQDSNYIPKSGDIIFFDWDKDGNVNHVGIVEKVENNYIYTIEGNSTNDTCRQKKYHKNNKAIYGYGTPNYD